MHLFNKYCLWSKIHIYFYIDIPQGNCTTGDLRLVGGNDQAGQLEICYGGFWGTVCDRNFSPVDANIACRQLGFYGKFEIEIIVQVNYLNLKCHVTMIYCPPGMNTLELVQNS